MAILTPEEVSQIIVRIEGIAGEDRGKRGMGPLLRSGELEEMVSSLRQATSVAILTGYPCCLHDPPTETDGPLGAVAMARALNALGIRTVILTDECNEAPISAALKASFEAYPPARDFRKRCIVRAFPGGGIDAKKTMMQYELDYVIAIERPGPADDGGYYTMSGRDMSQSVAIAKLEQLLDLRGRDGKRFLKSAGIGDGGNELGMGKRRALVSEHVKLGDKIGCIIETDHLVAAGVSNWGGWAVCFALYVHVRMSTPTDHDMTTAFLAADTDLMPVLPNCEGELAVLQAMVAAGARDGITGKAAATVDDLPWGDHAGIVVAMRECIGV